MCFTLLLAAAEYACAFSASPSTVFTRSFGLKRGRQPTQKPDIHCFSSQNRNYSLFASQNDSDEPSGLSTPLDRPILAMVDLASLLTFAAVGKASHTPDGSIDPLATASVAFPFLVAWFATSPFTGVYSPDERTGNLLLDTFVKSGKGWIVAVPLGCVIRGIIKGYVPPLPFVVVTMIATFVILGLGRLLFAVLEDFFC